MAFTAQCKCDAVQQHIYRFTDPGDCWPLWIEPLSELRESGELRIELDESGFQSYLCEPGTVADVSTGWSLNRLLKLERVGNEQRFLLGALFRIMRQ